MVTNLTENFLTALLEFLVNSDGSVRVFQLWPNFGKSPLWARLKQLEFLSLPQSADITETHFKYFYTFLVIQCIFTVLEH